MTRDEAIEILSFYQNSLNNWGADRIAKAFDMAIEALSTTNTENVSNYGTDDVRSRCEVDAKCDLISRTDAIEAVANMLYEEPPYLNTEVKCYKYAEKLISALPSAEAVDVVWCKDCRYRKKVGTSYYCDLDEFNVKDADFCSWGERREE